MATTPTPRQLTEVGRRLLDDIAAIRAQIVVANVRLDSAQRIARGSDSFSMWGAHDSLAKEHANIADLYRQLVFIEKYAPREAD